MHTHNLADWRVRPLLQRSRAWLNRNAATKQTLEQTREERHQ